MKLNDLDRDFPDEWAPALKPFVGGYTLYVKRAAWVRPAELAEWLSGVPTLRRDPPADDVVAAIVCCAQSDRGVTPVDCSIVEHVSLPGRYRQLVVVGDRSSEGAVLYVADVEINHVLGLRIPASAW